MAKGISKECLDEALTALKDFSSEELKQYAYDVFEKAKKYPGMSNAKAFAEAMKEINNDRLKSYFEAVMTTANNTVKVNYLVNRIKTGKANLKNISIKRGANQGDNVAAAQVSARQELESTFFDKVTREETEFLTSGNHDEQIADAFDGKKVDSQEANTIAKLWKDVYFPERNANLITSNAMPFDHINQDRSFRNVHDSNRMIMGGKSSINEAKSKGKFKQGGAKNKWIETVKKRFDLIHSDAVDIHGNVDEEKLNEILGDMYDNITTNKSDVMTRSEVVNDRQAIQNRSRRRLQPKSMRDFVEYNNEYGQGNLYGAMVMDMQTSANKIGAARMLGDSPLNAYLDLRAAQQETNPEWGGGNFHRADLYFNEVMSSNKAAVSPTVAAIDANIRTLTSMARLPLIALRSIPDLANMATFGMNHGYNYFSAWGEHLKGLFDLYHPDDRKFIAKMYSNMFRQHLGYMGRVADASNSSEVMNKISTAFFKWNGLHRFDMGNKMSGIYVACKGLGNHARKSFDALPLATKNWVARFLEPSEWELLRGKGQHGLFTVDNVNALTEKEIRDFYNAGNKDKPLHEVRNDLYRKVHAMAQIASENMVLNPGEFEKAFLLGGTKPGSPGGVLLRQLSQFKMYSLSFVDKVLIQGYKTADASQQKLAWATATLIGAMPLSYAMLWLENMAFGKTMPDISRMNNVQRAKFLLELSQPGLALFSGILDPRHQNSDMILNLLGSPSIRLLGNAMATFVSAAEGDLKAAGKHFRDTMSYIVPLKTTPVLTPYINEIMGDKGHLEPGQHHLYGR